MKYFDAAGVILRLAANDRAVPVHVLAPRDPALAGPEAGFAEDRAAQRGCRGSGVAEIKPPIIPDSLEEPQLIRVTVLPAEELPGEVDLNESVVSEEAIPGDRVERVLEPEEYGLPGLHLLERLGRLGRPEIDLVDNPARGLGQKKVEPRLIGEGNEGLHGLILPREPEMVLCRVFFQHASGC